MRISTFIRRQQATNFAPAIRLAEKMGLPLNQSITINFTHTVTTIQAVSTAFARLRDTHFGPWLRRPSRKSGFDPVQAAFIWVIENTAGHTAVHWLVHVPENRLADLSAKLPVWLEKVTGGIHCTHSAINIKATYNLFGLRQYMLKGIDPTFADFYRIRHIPQGLIYGKRCGFSQNLGPTSCRRNRTYHSQIWRDRWHA